MTTSRAFDPIDIHVGAQVRARREAIQKTQTDMARALGVTFQQVQKYEKGANRISASMLFRAAGFLGCEPGELFPASDAGPAAPLITRVGMASLTRKLAGLSESRWQMARKIIAALDAEDPILTPAERLTEANARRDYLNLPRIETLP